MFLLEMILVILVNTEANGKKTTTEQQNIRLGENHVPQKINLYRQNEPADGFNK